MEITELTARTPNAFRSAESLAAMLDPYPKKGSGQDMHILVTLLKSRGHTYTILKSTASALQYS